MFKRILSLVLVAALAVSALMIAPAAAVADQSAAAPVSAGSDDIMLSSADSIGDIFSSAVNRELNTGDYGVTDVTVDGGMAEVSLNNAGECMVVVGAYDEADDTLIATGIRRDIPAGAGSVIVYFSSPLPEFFYIRAFILDADCCPLGEQYESSRYTSAYADFLSKTVADFPSERIMNLDSDPADNFAVLGSRVRRIAADSSVNTPRKTGDNAYTFDHVDNTLRGLKAGDIIAYDFGGASEIIKISSVRYNGDTAVITAASAKMEEVFDYVKIDAYSAQPQNSPTGTAHDADPAPTGMDLDMSYSVNKTYSMNDSDEATFAGVTGSVEVGLTAAVKIHYSDEIREIALIIDCCGKISVALTARISRAIPLGLIPIPTPIPSVTVNVMVELELSAEATAELSIPFSSRTGFGYSSREGFNNLSTIPTFGFEGRCEGKAYAGLKVSPSLSALFGLVSAGIGGKVGVELIGTRQATVTDFKTSDHLCRWCIEGTVDLVFAAEAELRFLGKRTYDLGSISKKLFDFHYSTDHGFGLGVCMNRSMPEGQQEHQKPVFDSGSGNRTCTITASESGGTYTAYFTGRGTLDSYELYGAGGFIYNYNEAVKEEAFKLYSNMNLDAAEYSRRYNKYCDEHFFKCGNKCSRFVVYISGFSSVKFNGNCRYREKEDDVPITSIEIHITDTCTYFDAAYLEEVNTVVTFPNTLRYIDTGFGREHQRPKGLKSLVIPPNVEYIGNNAFNGSPLTELVIPPSVKYIDDFAFADCPIDDLVIPSTIEYVGYGAFSGCKSLAMMADMPYAAFLFCANKNLKKVRFGDKVTEIPDSMFMYSGVESVTIPGTVKSVDLFAFAGCEDLREVIIEDGVKEIGMAAFHGCPKLERVSLPSSLSLIYVGSFLTSFDTQGRVSKKVIIDYNGTVEEWNNIISYIYKNEETGEIITRKMSDPDDQVYSSFYHYAIVYCHNDNGGDPVPTGGLARTGAAQERMGGLYAGADYLIAVEDSDNGRLNGGIMALSQAKADKNGSIDVTGVRCSDGECLNVYGACRHPSAHATTDGEGKIVCICDICGAETDSLLTDQAAPVIPDEEEVLRGDADGDGEVTIFDATAIQRTLASLPVSNYHAEAADADRDGEISIFDATAIQRWLAGYDPDLYGISEIFYISHA